MYCLHCNYMYNATNKGIATKKKNTTNEVIHEMGDTCTSSLQPGCSGLYKV